MTRSRIKILNRYWELFIFIPGILFFYYFSLYVSDVTSAKFFQLSRINNLLTYFWHLGSIWHVPGNIRIRRSVFRNKGTVFPRCHSSSSIQPSLSLHSLGLLVHAEELCCFASDVAETENKAPFELFVQQNLFTPRVPSTFFYHVIKRRTTNVTHEFG